MYTLSKIMSSTFKKEFKLESLKRRDKDIEQKEEFLMSLFV